jgi:hypothetical protein
MMRLQGCDQRVQGRYTTTKLLLMQRLAQFQANHSEKWDGFLHRVRNPQLSTAIYLPLSELHKVLVLQS